MRKLGGLFAVVVLLLSGCASVSMPEIAASECAKVAEDRDAYNRSLKGDGRLMGVTATDIGEPRQHEDGGDAYRVSGISTARMDDGRAVSVEWECFVQRADGKVYSAITSWSVA